MTLDEQIQQNLTQGLTNVGNDLWYDPSTGAFKSLTDPGATEEGKWAWGPTGLVPLGGSSSLGVDTPFLSVSDKYKGGEAIQASTWQDAVRQSLTGFMRANYGVDPALFWNNQNSGLQGSQFRLGTLQDLVRDPSIPGTFFDTSGPLIKNAYTGNIVDPTASDHWTPSSGVSFDPLLGFNPEDKFLAFEDTPLSTVEQFAGAVPGMFMDTRRVSGYQTQFRNLQNQYNQLSQLPPNTASTMQMQQLAMQMQGLGQKITSEGFKTLDQLKADPSIQDFNDYLFRLDINPYNAPSQLIQANPESVLKKFFDTPAYRLAYGNDPNTRQMNPQDRFQADPGYQFAQTEGLRQVQRAAAAKGLINSGPVLKEMDQYSQGLADQNYQRFQAQNLGLFSDWQNQLAGIAQQGLGAASQGSGAANQVGQLLSQLQQTLGSNVGNLLTGQGAFGSGAILNTGAAGASNIMSAGQINAQIAAENAKLQAAKNGGNQQGGGQGGQSGGGSSGGGGGKPGGGGGGKGGGGAGGGAGGGKSGSF